MSDVMQIGVKPVAHEIEQMVAHHAAMRAELERRVTGLVAAVTSGGPFDAERTAVREFIGLEVVPHALAEEDAIYLAGTKSAAHASLVAGMTMEHETLVGLGKEVAEAGNGVLAAAAAAAFLTLFEVHVRKENVLLLPGLVEEGVEPARLLSEMHVAFAGRRAAAVAAAHAKGEAAELVVDTREHAAGSCANLTTLTVDAIPPGGSFVLVADHDPRGLRYMLDAERPGMATWDLLEDGPETWRVRITK